MLFNVKRWPVLPMTALLLVMAFAMVASACGEDPKNEITIKQTPVAEDFTVTGLQGNIANGGPKAVTVTPKTGKSPGAITVYYNGSAAAPSAVGDYGVTFDVAAAEGWNAAVGLSAGTLEIDSAPIDDPTDDPDDPIDDPVDDPVTFTVTFDKNGGDTDAIPQTRTVTEGETQTVALPTTEPTRDGYRFIGWKDESDEDFTDETPVTDDITVYAQWEQIVYYSVTFYDNNVETGAATNAGQVVATVQVEDGHTVELPEAPTRAARTFDSWNTAAYGTGDAFTDETPVTANISVYAQWWHHASLASLTINGVEATFPAVTTNNRDGHPNKGVNGLTVWNGNDYTTITMTSTEYNVLDLNIVATPRHPGAKIVGYAVTNSSSNLYSGSNVNTTNWARDGLYDLGGIEDGYHFTGQNRNGTTGAFRNASTDNASGTFDRIFVWVKDADGNDGFYRIQRINIQN